jgi:hypothetical protein
VIHFHKEPKQAKCIHSLRNQIGGQCWAEGTSEMLLISGMLDSNADLQPGSLCGNLSGSAL